MVLPLSNELADALERGDSVIIQARLARHRCETTGLKSRHLARDFVLARVSRASRLMRGASDVVDVRSERPREVWLHRPTGQRWVVLTDTMGAPASAAGPFTANEWDPLLRDYVALDRRNALAWLREHIHEFERGNDGQS